MESKSLETLRMERLSARKRLNEISFYDPNFNGSVIAFQKACSAFDLALEESTKAMRAFTSSLVNVRLDYDQAKRLKLPRKAKKRFIKQYGRKEYHRRYYRPGIILEINSPGGYTWER